MAEKKKVSRFQELDALRGLAAVMVVFFHFTMGGRPEAQLGFKYGVSGVDLFFIISGFVIFMSLSRVKTGLDFVINRTSRLYPTYWTAVTFTFLLVLGYTYFMGNDAGLMRGSRMDYLVQYLGNMTMFQFYMKIPDLDGPYWTMIIEMIFYIFMLILFQIKKLNYLNIIGVFLSVFIAVVHNFFSMPVIEKIVRVIPFFQYLPLFFAGTVFYKIFTEKSNYLKYYSILAVCLVSQISMYPYSGRYLTFITQPEYAISVLVYFLLFIMFVHGKLKFVVSKVALFFGKISYALYLIHQLISTKIVLPYLLNELHLNFWVASLLIAFPIVVGLAAWITYFVEVPYSKKMKTKLRSLLVKE